MEKGLYSCQGKARFSTYSQAAAVAGRRTRRNNLRPGIYHCLFCEGFHIGNNKPKQKSVSSLTHLARSMKEEEE